MRLMIVYFNYIIYCIFILTLLFKGLECKLKITSFNCQGFKFRNYNYVKEIFKQCNILMLQETWLFNFEHNNFIKEIPDCHYYAISDMDEADVSRVGRPKGGVAILWHKDLKLTFVPIITNSKRVCALNIKSDNCNIIMINVYMPNDNETEESYTMYGDIISEISSIMYTHDNCNFIFGGDFNVDYGRSNSRNLNLLKDFLVLETLTCATFDILENNFTRLGSLGEKSFIDHFITCNFFEYKVDVTYDGHNLSDHMPVNLQTVINSEFVTNSNVTSYKHDWNNITDEKIIKYKQLLDYNFENFVIPQNILECTNFQCKIHNNLILDLLEHFMSVISDCSDKAIGVKHIGQLHKSGTMGWNNFVQPYKEKSIFWHNIWKSAGCPVTGQLADLCRFTQAKSHWAIKRTKRDADEYLRNKTANQMVNKSSDKFWSSIRKMKGSENTIASVVDDQTTDGAISDRFRLIYNDLYNSIDDDNFVNIIDDVNNLVDNKCSSGMCASAHCHTVTGDTVRKAIFKLKSDKDDEVYSLCTNSFIHATDLVFEKLGQLITLMIRHGLASEIINTSIIKPIPKNKKKLISDSNNYRAISKNTIISKIIDYILIDKVGDKLTTSTYQFAYKEGYSTSMCSFLIAETIQYYKNNGSTVFMLSLDATKAFDLVQYSKLFKLLIDRDICPLLIRLLINIYLSSIAIVKWNGVQSEPYTLGNGVKQGAVISAPLFAVYINPLINNLQLCKQGCYLANICTNAFAYADDIVLLTPSCTALRSLIKICEKYADTYKLRFNPDKCTLMILADKNADFFYEHCKISLCGRVVKNVKTEKHLGHSFTSNNHSHLINIDSIIRDIKIRTNTIIDNFRYICWQSKVKLFLSQCSSLYGSTLWRLDDKQSQLLMKTWNICCRRLLGLPPHTRTYVLPHIMNTMPIKYTIMYRMLNLFVSGINHKCDTISMLFKMVLI